MHQDLENLQGHWNVTFLEVDGIALPFAGARIIIEDGRFTSLAMGAAYQGTVTVGAGTTQKTFGLYFTDGPEAGTSNFGIYELDGDNWKICLNMTGGPAPAAFVTSPGSGHALETLHRAGPNSETGPAREQSGPPTELEGDWAMVSCIRDGEPLDKNFVKRGRREYSGNKTVMFFADQLFMQAGFTLDPAQQPKRIDFVNAQGPGAGKTQYGIYELDGRTLKTCFAAPGHPRPGDYKTEHGDGRTVTIWNRVDE